jgi:hypothetical protein
MALVTFCVASSLEFVSKNRFIGYDLLLLLLFPFHDLIAPI